VETSGPGTHHAEIPFKPGYSHEALAELERYMSLRHGHRIINIEEFTCVFDGLRFLFYVRYTTS
jgi:hypothetical protein